jgi:hypothetical protein
MTRLGFSEERRHREDLLGLPRFNAGAQARCKAFPSSHWNPEIRTLHRRV